MRFVFGAFVVAAVVVAIGCEGNISATPETAQSGSAAPPPPDPTPPGDPNQAPASQTAKPAAMSAAAPGDDSLPPAADDSFPEPAGDVGFPSPAAAEEAAEGTTEKATVGVGAKGRDYGGPGFVTTPIKAYFTADARINFLQMANAMKIYKAGNDNKGPATHEEFMNVIIKENGVQLPVLPDGDEYVYDPKSEELLVKHPAQ